MAVFTSSIAANGTNGSKIYVSVPAEPIFAVETPAALTSTALKFEYSPDDGTTWKKIYNEGTEYSLTVAASRFIVVNAAVFRGLSCVRPVAQSSEAAARVIKFHTAIS